nr:GNAT family N-acetyltransferase [Sporosarcina luteola]
MQKNDINQWGFLLEGGEDVEISQAVGNRDTYVACQDNEIIATFSLYSKQSEWDQHVWGQEENSEVLYLHRLAVRPDYMKKGIGRDIFSWIDENIYTPSYVRTMKRMVFHSSERRRMGIVNFRNPLERKQRNQPQANFFFLL